MKNFVEQISIKCGSIYSRWMWYKLRLYKHTKILLEFVYQPIIKRSNIRWSLKYRLKKF